MATQVQNRRGSTAEHSTFTGAVGEVTIDTDKDTAVVHDGSTAGGRPLLREDLSNLPAGTIDNADINASAAIAGTKISPNFGSQNVTTTGTSTAASFIPSSSTVPTNGLYLSAANSVALSTNGNGRLFIDSSGNVGIGVSPATPLDTVGTFQWRSNVGGTDKWLRFTGGAGLIYDGTTTNTAIGFLTNGSERLRITSTGQLSHIGAGSSGSPAVSFSGSAASNSLVVNSTGQVSIGSSSAVQQLTVNGNLAVGGAGNNGIEFYNANPTATALRWFLANNSGGSDTLQLYRYNSSGGYAGAPVCVTSAGLVGIGTSSASANLTVNGSAATTAHGIHILRNGYTAIGRLGYQSTDGSQLWLTNNYNPTTGAADSAEGGSLNFASNGETRFFTANNERARIDSSGRLGIGHTSPGAFVDVAGDIRSRTANPVVYLNNLVTQWGLRNNGDALTAEYQGTERFRCDSSGRLLVGTTSTSSVNRLIVQSSSDAPTGAGTLFIARGDNAPLTTNVLGALRFGGSTHVNSAEISAFRDGGTWTAGSSLPTGLAFSTTSDGQASPTPRLTITSTGQVRLAGAGITFNGDTAAANELDDYEEGTFTPTITGGTTAGTATYSAQVGNYTKIGRQVNFTIYIVWSGGTGTGDLRISGLPFTVANLNSWSASFGIAADVTTAANTVITGYAVQNGAYIAAMNTAVGGGALSATAYDAAGTLLISGSYAA